MISFSELLMEGSKLSKFTKSDEKTIISRTIREQNKKDGDSLLKAQWEGCCITIPLAQAREWGRKAKESSKTTTRTYVLAVKLISILATG